MDLHQVIKEPDLDDIFSADLWARQSAERIIKGFMS